MAKIFIFLIRFYQIAFSWFLGGRCRFGPSCSEYAKEAFITLPWHRALGLSIWRILRCGPWSKGGHDPVPKP